MDAGPKSWDLPSMNLIVDRNPDQDAEANQPVLSDAERAALIGSLDAAYRRMEAGDYAVLIPGTLATMMEPYLAPATPHR